MSALAQHSGRGRPAAVSQTTENATGSAAVIEEVIVTARKREERAIDAPVANCTNTPSPRFSMAGNQLTSNARSARSTSLSYSPWMSRMAASRRVKPMSAITSRSRWS